MAKQALKKKNGNAENGKVIPLNPRQLPLEDANQVQIALQRDKDVEKALSKMSGMSVQELVDIAVYSQYRRLRKAALALLPRDIGIMESIHHTTTYQDMIDATKSIIDETKPKTS